MTEPTGQPQYGLYTRLSRPLQRVANCVAVLATLCLIAILFPVGYSRGKAREASCMSNEKLICLGLLQYVQDYDEHLPCGARINRRGSDIVQDTPEEKIIHAGQGWAGTLWLYEKNAPMFACPESVRQDSRAGESIVAGGREAQLWTVSYAYNRNFALNRTLADLADPARSVLLSEVDGAKANVMDRNEYNPQNVYSPAGNGISILAATDGATGYPVSAGVRYATGIPGGYGQTESYLFRHEETGEEMEARHHEGANYTMADGHAKWIKPVNISPGDNAPNPKAAQNNAKRQAAGTGNLGAFAVTYSTK